MSREPLRYTLPAWLMLAGILGLLLFVLAIFPLIVASCLGTHLWHWWIGLGLFSGVAITGALKLDPIFKSARKR